MSAVRKVIEGGNELRDLWQGLDSYGARVLEPRQIIDLSLTASQILSRLKVEKTSCLGRPGKLGGRSTVSASAKRKGGEDCADGGEYHFIFGGYRLLVLDGATGFDFSARIELPGTGMGGLAPGWAFSIRI